MDANPQPAPQQLPGSEAMPPVNIQVHLDGKKVVLEFDRELRWISMAPAEARRLADAIKMQSMIIGGR